MESTRVRFKPDEIVKKCFADPTIYMTIWTDKSGGFFSLKDMKPKALVELTQDKDLIDKLNREYEELRSML